MHWFSGIGLTTPIREIGWTYVTLAAGLITFGVLVVRLYRGR